MKVIIDTDPGNDDAIAILLAIASPEIDLLGITAVVGNVPVAITSRNARMICEMASREYIPVYNGEDKPLKKPQVTGEDAHGRSGLEGVEIVEPKFPPESKHAVDLIIESVLSNEGEISICAMGPLTNIARAFEREPRLPKMIKELVIMGGSKFQGGNITPMAEFNFYVDPHAADIVFKSGANITLAPLDVTFQARMEEEWIHRLADAGDIGKFARDILMPSYRFNSERYEGEYAPLHDPFTVAYIIDPSLFKKRPVRVSIETESPLCMGASSIDWWNVTGDKPNCNVLSKVDSDGYFELIYQCVKSLDNK
jgi:purine nucleosidase|tara:strand:- start:1386 stop:2318 length:933 start_codon:yes stop_codon:yes gene_type:complete